MTLLELKNIISGYIKIYTPVEKAPYWEEKFYGDIVQDYSDIPAIYLNTKVHHIEGEWDKDGDPIIGIHLEN